MLIEMRCSGQRPLHAPLRCVQGCSLGVNEGSKGRNASIDFIGVLRQTGRNGDLLEIRFYRDWRCVSFKSRR